MKVLINVILYASFLVLFNGCILTHPGCITSGKINAMECGRYANRYDWIEKHKTTLKKLNKKVNTSELGKKLTDNEINSFYNRFCKKYDGKELPLSKDLAADFEIYLGNYFTQKFCQMHTQKKQLGLFEKITQTSIDYGYVTWYISDEKKIYEYKNEPITYFKNGIKYGIATFSK